MKTILHKRVSFHLDHPVIDTVWACPCIVMRLLVPPFQVGSLAPIKGSQIYVLFGYLGVASINLDDYKDIQDKKVMNLGCGSDGWILDVWAGNTGHTYQLLL